MKESLDKMVVKLEREQQEREEAMQRVRELENRLNDANTKVTWTTFQVFYYCFKMYYSNGFVTCLCYITT